MGSTAESRSLKRNTSEADRPIGVFDSGIGGLTAVRELRRVLPAEDIIYLGDTARVPYGTKSEETIKRFAEQDVDFLRRFDIKLIVVACNTVSSVAIEHLRAKYRDLPILGVLEPGVEEACRTAESGRIGVIGTIATIESRRHVREIKKRGDFQVLCRPCPLFVPLAEEGLVTGQIPELVAHMYLDELRGKVDSLILGCTHYPLLTETISRVMGPGVKLINVSHEVARKAREYLGEKGFLREKGRGNLRVYLTDIPPHYEELIYRFLGEKPESVEKVELEF